MEIKSSIVIDRHVEDVWDHAADVGTWPEWNSQLVDTNVTTEGPIDVGTTYRYTARMMGRDIEHESEITEFDPPHRICFRTPTGAMPLEGCYTLEARGEQTLVTIAAEGSVEGFLSFAEPLIEKMANRMWRTNLENLQEELEGDDL